MKSQFRNFVIPILLIFVFFLHADSVSGQLVLGQYHDEAPLRTWNLFGIVTAPSLGMGGTRYARAFDTSTATTNPALLSDLTRFNVTINGVFSLAEMFRFGPVNTGPLIATDNSSAAVYALDFAGISFQTGKWSLAMTAAVSESYHRPDVELEVTSGGNPDYRFDYSQEGCFRTINLAVSREITAPLSLGLGLNFISGFLDRNLRDEWLNPAITVSDERYLSFSGYFLNGGVKYQVLPELTLGLAFRTPFVRKADGESRLETSAPAAGGNIVIDSDEESRFSLPLVVGMGLNWQISRRFAAAADVSFFNWARYKLVYFGEEQDRSFKNTIPLSLGLEYKGEVQLFGTYFDTPTWVGLGYDPQPMREPGSRYYLVSFGAGLQGNHFYLNLSSQFGWERGSGADLKTRHIALTIGYR